MKLGARETWPREDGETTRRPLKERRENESERPDRSIRPLPGNLAISPHLPTISRKSRPIADKKSSPVASAREIVFICREKSIVGRALSP